jgi:uncharacterized protein (TIGR03546 family)
MTWLILKIIRSSMKLFQAENSANSIACGIAYGLVMGLPPFNWIYILIFSFGLCIFRINLAAVFIGFNLAALISLLTVLVAHSIGLALLSMESLHGLWTWIYNAPIIGLLNLNNSVVCGQTILSLILAIPLFILAKYTALNYQSKIAPYLANTRLMRALKLSKFGKWLARAWRLIA